MQCLYRPLEPQQEGTMFSDMATGGHVMQSCDLHSIRDFPDHATFREKRVTTALAEQSSL